MECARFTTMDRLSYQHLQTWLGCTTGMLNDASQKRHLHLKLCLVSVIFFESYVSSTCFV